MFDPYVPYSCTLVKIHASVRRQNRNQVIENMFFVRFGSAVRRILPSRAVVANGLRRKPVMVAATLVATLTTSTIAVSCDPIEAFHALWSYLSTSRKDIQVKEQMKDEIIKVRDQFHLRNIDVQGQVFLFVLLLTICSLFDRFQSLSRAHKSHLSRKELELVLSECSPLFNAAGVGRNGH